MGVRAAFGMHYENPGMNDATPSLKQLNRTFIGSVLFIDIVGYSKRTVPDQLAMKELFNSLLAEAVQNVAAAERIMVDTGDGAGVAFLGDPEDALFAALSLRDAVDTGKATGGEPGFVRMGINLGPLKMVRDINGHTNMIGDGVNDAQRVMTFAEPGQVMVSHSYYDIISRFSRDYAQLFVYEGTRHDKHVREHEVYRFGPVDDNQNLAEKLRDRSRARQNGGADGSSSDAPGTAFVPAGDATIHRSRNAISRFGLILTMVGTITAAGAVWSWTSMPDSGTATRLAPAVHPMTEAPREAMAMSVSDQPRPTHINSVKQESAPKSGQTVAMLQPATERTAAQKPADKYPEQFEEKSAKAADSPAPAAAKPGTIKLAVQPWGEIYVDGSKRGISPPLKSLNLTPGKHRVEIRNSQFAPYKETIEVKSGVDHTVKYAF
jgi:class 3 adenylate cyclase